MKIEFDTEKELEIHLELIKKIIETKIEDPYGTQYLKIIADDPIEMAELKQTMNHLIDDQGSCMFVEEIIARIDHKKINKKLILNLLEELKKQGKIFETREGFVRVI